MIYVGADHRGFELKNKVTQWLDNLQLEYQDLGANALSPDDDYNDYAIAVARAVLSNPGSFGILICGSAQGMCMQANRFRGIRAALCHTPTEATETRGHNDANILCLSADQPDDFEQIIQAFVETPILSDDRYLRRNRKLDEES